MIRISVMAELRTYVEDGSNPLDVLRSFKAACMPIVQVSLEVYMHEAKATKISTIEPTGVSSISDTCLSCNMSFRLRASNWDACRSWQRTSSIASWTAQQIMW